MNRLRMFHRDSLSCEPILRRMPNGELLCVSQCGDVTEPAPGNRVYAFHSADEGETWSRPESVWPEDGQAVYLTEVMVLNGEVTVFLTLHGGKFVPWNCMMIKSRDCGYTWETAGTPPFFPTYTFMRGMITTQRGDILVAYQHYPVSEEENKRLVEEKLPWREARITEVQNGVICSRDGGKTWEKHDGPSVAIKGDTGRDWAWTEPTIVELEPGHIAMLLRVCRTGCLWESHSYDGGMTWTPAVQTSIPNPSNKPKLIRLPAGAVALIHTPNPKHGFEGRNPLSVWISRDGMKTWPYRRIITDFPGAFCYPDGFYEAGHLLFTIEYNRHDLLFVDHEIEELP